MLTGIILVCAPAGAKGRPGSERSCVRSRTDLIVQHSTASLHPGEPDHPKCQEEAVEEP